MTNDAIAPPEPKEIDETRSMVLRRLSANAGLRRSVCFDRLSRRIADDGWIILCLVNPTRPADPGADGPSCRP